MGTQLFRPSTGPREREKISRIVSACYTIGRHLSTTTAFRSCEDEAMMACCILWNYDINFKMTYKEALSALGEELKDHIFIRGVRGKKGEGKKSVIEIRSVASVKPDQQKQSHYNLIKSLAVTFCRDYSPALCREGDFVVAVNG